MFKSEVLTTAGTANDNQSVRSDNTITLVTSGSVMSPKSCCDSEIQSVCLETERLIPAVNLKKDVDINKTRSDCRSSPVKFCIMSAMCHSNRGIAKDLKLPWPSLR